MLAKLPERRCRQKLKQRTHEDTNPETALEYFQVSVNIVEAKNLVWAQSQAVNSYVVVMLGKEKYRTSVRKNIEDPAFKEYILFEWYTTLRDVQHSTLWMGVMEPRCCAPPRLLGETSIDLGVIWAQPNHQVYHKWAQLSIPRDPAAGTVGFLKVDITIMCKGDVQVMPVIVTPEKLGENILPSVTEQQTANYQITVYNGFGIFGLHEQGERRQEKLPSTYVKVCFSGVTAKTAVQARSNNPCYCEQISITDMFPNVCQTVRLEVCSAVKSFNQPLATIDLNLEQISYDGDNGYVPTFGPSLLHMYGNFTSSGIEVTGDKGPFYKGALLVALRTFVPFCQRPIKTTNVEPIAAIQMDSILTWQDFCIFCPILEVSMLDRRLIGGCCGVAITIGEIPYPKSDNECFMLLKREIKKRKLHYTGPIDVAKVSKPYGHLDFTNAFPVLQIATRLPDFRFRIYRNNLVERIVERLEISICDVEKRLHNFEYLNPSELLNDLTNAIDVAANHIRTFFEIAHLFDPSAEGHGNTNHYGTELDQKQLALQKEELEKIYHQIREKIQNSSTVNLMKLVGKTSNECYSISKKNVKMLLVESILFTQKLKSIVFKSPQGWPDIVLWLLNEGSRFAFHKISLADVIFSEIPEQNGKHCGRIRTIYMQPLKCPKHLNIVPSGCTCIAGKVELMVWMGLNSNTAFFHSCLPQGLRIKAKDYEMCVKASIIMVECRVFVYRAKFTTVESGLTPCSFVRVNFLNCIRDTKVEQKTSTPVWDQVLTVNCMTRTSQERIVICPPEVTVEVYDHDPMGKLELIGRLEYQPVVGDKLNADYAPRLKWYDLRLGHVITGQILMSALVKQILDSVGSEFVRLWVDLLYGKSTSEQKFTYVPETLVKSTIYSTNENNETIGHDSLLDGENEVIEEIPRSLKPKYLGYKVDVYWWGLRDVSISRKPCAVLEMDDLIIKSDVIAEKKSNCNFPNGRISQTFEGHLDKDCCPSLIIKLYDSSTFGRVIFLGTHAVKNPIKYLVDWLPKYERETSLRTVSFSSSNFLRVNKTLYVKKSTTSCESTTEFSKMTVSSNAIADNKRSTWRKLFCRKEPDEEEYVLLPMHLRENEQNQLANNTYETEYQDWWSRFFSSQREPDDNCFGKTGKIKIYNSELELQPEFNKFKDWCSTLHLYKGKKTGILEKNTELRCGLLKAAIAIYRWPPPPDTVAVNLSGVELQQGFFNDFPSNDASKFLVRVYVVRGLHLTPKDFNSKCHPYIIVKCGKNKFGDRNQFFKHTNPIFGRTYEFRCTLPEDYLLTVSVYDHETLTPDGLIGSTSIDLEDRIYSKHQARVGLSSEYNVTGALKWRDREKPSEILAKLCTRNHMRSPVFPDGNTVLVNGIEYRDSDKSSKTYLSASERKENICLNLLHKWHTLPLCGYHLVPEHVETRNIMNSEKSAIQQGKIQMWVDIFPLETGIYLPLPVDITPRKVEDYELRVIIWHVHSLRHAMHDIKRGLDLYVKSWIGNVEEAHFTDVHYNCVHGEASFNWRMIFHFQYQHSNKKLITMEKGPFTEFEEHLPPILVVQVADCDAESIDDYLAILTLDLNAIPRGSKQITRSSVNNMENSKKINLFSARSVRSWWPLKCVDKNSATVKFAGMIEMELHLLPKDKATIMPVGLGRDPPFPLPEPNRPDPYSTKMKSSVLQSIFSRGAAEYIAGAIFLAIFIAAFYWELPNVMFSYFIG